MKKRKLNSKRFLSQKIIRNSYYPAIDHLLIYDKQEVNAEARRYGQYQIKQELEEYYKL